MRLEDYGRAEVLAGKSWKKKGSVNMGHGRELANFIATIAGKEKALGDVKDGLFATLVAQAAMASLKAGQRIEINHLTDMTSSESGGGTKGKDTSSAHPLSLIEEIIGASDSWDNV